MSIDTAGIDIIARFQRADTLLGQLQDRTAAVHAAAESVADHDRNIGRVAEKTGMLLEEVRMAVAVAGSAKQAFIDALDRATGALSAVQSQADAIDAESIVGALEARVAELQRTVQSQLADITAPLDVELVRLGQLATKVEDRLRFFEPDLFLLNVDRRVDDLRKQIDRLALAAEKSDELLDLLYRKDGLRDFGNRLGRIEARLSPALLIPAYLVLLLLLLLK